VVGPGRSCITAIITTLAPAISGFSSFLVSAAFIVMIRSMTAPPRGKSGATTPIEGNS
jgi:hypothetical protein